MTAFDNPAAFAPLSAKAGRPMRLLEWSIYRGPHFYSSRLMIRLQLDLGALEDWPTDRLPCFADRLITLLPGLTEHGCSYGSPMGFVRRLRDGTWLGHVIEHVALELQKLAGSPVTRGKTRSVKGRPGVYNILYQYRDEDTGLAAGAHAIRLVASLLPAGLEWVENLSSLREEASVEPTDVAAIVERLRQIRQRSALGPTTQALVDEAERRGIPVSRLNEGSLVQLGYGSRQKRLRASITGDTSQIGVDIAGDKDLAKRLLSQAGLPVPRGVVVRTADAATAAARSLGWPVVVKPLDGNHGRGVTLGIGDEDQLREAVRLAAKHSRRVIIEQQLPGSDHRILVVGGKVVAVAERVPAHVDGDGERTISALIDDVNRDPRRGEGHENLLTKIKPDEAMALLLSRRGYSLDTVPARGERVWLRETANLSTGGTATNRTDRIHPYNVAIAEQAAAVVGLDVCGIDFLSPDISKPVSETGGGIVELNAAPGFRMHLEPSSGTPLNVAAPVLGLLFPRGRPSRIPIFAITGTNGKSTTARMVARVLRQDGHNVGMTTTSGVYFNDHLIQPGDASGPKSARRVLANPLVDVAVLETARGGLLREGLGFDRADVGVVLNVTADHLGLKGIDTLEALADLKGVVVESVTRRGHSVLNADDPMCRRIARHARGRIVWFSLSGGSLMREPVKSHVAQGGMALVREPGRDGGTLVLHRNGERELVLEAAAIPATLAGIAEFNIANALAAAAICLAHGVDIARVREGLMSFSSSFEDSPGRLNIHDAHGMRIIMDYAHNPAGLAALGQVIDRMRDGHDRIIGMVSIPGDRRDDDIVAMGRIAAGLFDEIIFRESPDGRGRVAGEINALMSEGALQAGLVPEKIHRIVDEDEAVAATLALGQPGDLLAILPTSIERVWRQIIAYTPRVAALPISLGHAVAEDA